LKLGVTLFKSQERITPPPPEKKFPRGKIQTEDGHFVRSIWEKSVDDWLFTHHIVHGYDHEINIPDKRMLCDFYIPRNPQFQNGPIYIELWGMKTKTYFNRKETKISFYEKHQLNLIQLLPEDMQNLLQVLPERLKKAGMKLL
jgi:hypothetical protein